MFVILWVILILAVLGIYGLLELPNCAHISKPQVCGVDPAAVSMIFLASAQITKVTDLNRLRLQERLVMLSGGELVWRRPKTMQVDSQHMLQQVVVCSGKSKRKVVWVDVTTLEPIIRRKAA